MYYLKLNTQVRIADTNRSSQGKGAVNVNTVSLTFVPLQSISSDASKLQKIVTDTILTGIRDEKYSPGLKKQYELQLRHLQEELPSMEIMLAPAPIAPVSEYPSTLHELLQRSTS